MKERVKIRKYLLKDALNHAAAIGVSGELENLARMRMRWEGER